MEYAQLNESKTEALQVTTHGNIEWDETHFCPASALTEDEAALFRVVPLIITDPPVHDQITQTVVRDGCEEVDGQWRYKWRVDQLSPEKVSINQAAAATAEREAEKVRRAAAVAAITVTTVAGNTFDGDEVSQGRMARAIITLQSTGTPTTIWVLHDNGVIEASAAELSEALALAGAAQSALWVLP